MKKVTVYVKGFCPFCVAAKNLLNSKGIAFNEVDLSNDPETLMSLVEKHGMRTVPQIFFDEELIGGYQELAALDGQGQLESKLAQE